MNVGPKIIERKRVEMQATQNQYPAIHEDNVELAGLVALVAQLETQIAAIKSLTVAAAHKAVQIDRMFAAGIATDEQQEVVEVRMESYSTAFSDVEKEIAALVSLGQSELPHK
jgi:hypothetical protein